MTRIALGIDRKEAPRLAAAAAEAGHDVVTTAASAAELVDVVEAGKADAVITASTRRYLTRGLISACDARAIRLLGLTESDADRRHAAALGLYEVVDAHASWAEIAGSLTSALTVPGRLGGTESRPGTVIVVWGPTGAPGRTTLAINIAAEIAAHGHSVALADADTYGGAVAGALGVLDEAPGFAAACRLAGSGTLDRGELERVAERYSSPRGAFWVLTGIARPSRWTELPDERVERTIAACREWCEYVVVDVGFSLESDEEISSDLFAPHRNAATVASLRSADRIVAVGSADPVGMSRFLRAHIDLADVAGEIPCSVVMNRVRSSAVGIGPYGQVTSTLARFAGIENPVLVPDDRPGVDAAVLSGRTLRDAAPKSPARAAIVRFVENTLLPVPEPARGHARRRGVRSRTRTRSATLSA